MLEVLASDCEPAVRVVSSSGPSGALRTVSLPRRSHACCSECAHGCSHARSDHGSGEQTPSSPAYVEKSRPYRRGQEGVVDLMLDSL